MDWLGTVRWALTMLKPGHAKDDPRDNAALVALCNKGDAAALDALYERCLPCVMSTAKRFSPDEATAQDAAQDAFEWLLRQFPPHGPGLRLKAEVTRLLCKETRRTALAAGRRAKRCQASAMDPDDLPAPEVPLDDTLEKALAILPPPQREALRLHEVEGCTYCEIAARLGVPEGTVKSHVCIAKKHLRKWAALRRLPN